MKSPFLVGRRVYLRPHVRKDVDSWFQWFNDPEVTYFLEQGYFPTTKAKQIKRLNEMYIDSGGRQLQLAIIERKTNRLVGTIGLHQINFYNRNADVSIVIGDKRAWGRRYGEEAVRILVNHGFEKLNLHKITAGMVASNRASYELFCRLGFRKEAVLKDHIWLHSMFQNVIKLAIFKKGWTRVQTKSLK